MVTLKIRCRDASKIPNERLFEFGGKMTLIQIAIETPIVDTVGGTLELHDEGGRDGNQQNLGREMDTDSRDNTSSSRASDGTNTSFRFLIMQLH